MARVILLHILFYVCVRYVANPAHSYEANCVSNLLQLWFPCQYRMFLLPYNSGKYVQTEFIREGGRTGLTTVVNYAPVKTDTTVDFPGSLCGDL